MRDFWKALRISLRNKVWVTWLGYRYRPDGVQLYKPKKERSAT